MTKPQYTQYDTHKPKPQYRNIALKHKTTTQDYTHNTKHTILNHNIETQHWDTILNHNTIHAGLNTQN